MPESRLATCLRVKKMSEDLYNAIMNLNRQIVSQYIPDFLASLPIAAAIPCWLTLSVIWVAVAGPLTLIVYAALWILGAVLAPFTTARQDVLSLGSVLATLFCLSWMLVSFIILRFQGCIAMLGGITGRCACTA